MALIKCPECGREISDAAKQCPHCGFPINDKNNVTTNELEKKPTCTSEKNKSKKGLFIGGGLLIILLIVVGVIWFSKGTKRSCPPITENGVAPFELGASILDIPSKGDFYDTIVHAKPMYHVKGPLDGLYYEWNDNELRQHIEEYGDGEYYVLRTYINCYVISNNETLMIVTYDKDSKITEIKVLSDKFKYTEGVCTRMSSSELFSKFNAKYVTTENVSYFGGHDTIEMGYELPNMPNSVSIIAAKKNKISFDCPSKKGEGYLMAPCHGELINYNYGIYSIPLEDIMDDYVAYIVIKKNGYPRLYGREYDYSQM